MRHFNQTGGNKISVDKNPNTQRHPSFFFFSGSGKTKSKYRSITIYNVPFETVGSVWDTKLRLKWNEIGIEKDEEMIKAFPIHKNRVLQTRFNGYTT